MRMVATSMNVFILLSSYIGAVVVGCGACSMASISQAACLNFFSLLTCGNGICCGKNSTVSASRNAPVSGMKHLKHL